MIGISDRDFVPLAPNEGIKDAVFPHPARIGDTIRVESEVVALDRDARSVRLRHRALTAQDACIGIATRSEEHTSELQSLMRISYAVFCLKKKKTEHNAHGHRPTNQPNIYTSKTTYDRTTTKL